MKWVSLFTLFIISNTPQTSLAQEEIQSKAQVSVYLYNNGNADISRKDLAVVSHIIIVKANQSIQDILLNASIFPNDIDIYTLLYELNPSIQDLELLKPGTAIKIPSLIDKNTLSKDQKMVIHLDDTLKSNIINNSVMLAKTLATIDSTKLSIKKKNSMTNYYKANSELQKISSGIRERTYPITHEQLINVNYESNVLIKQIQNIYEQDTTADSIRLSIDIYTDLKYLASCFRERKGVEESRKNSFVKVKVSIFRLNSKEPVTGYRVCYQAPALKGIQDPNQFSTVGGVVQGEVSEANWKFWATKIGKESFEVNTDVVFFEARQSKQNNNIDLYIKDGK